MTHSPKGAKPRFDEVEHKLYNRISSRLSSARQNRERSKSAEEIRRVRSPLRVSRHDRDNVGPRSQRFRDETRTRNGTDNPRERRDRYRSRSRSPVLRERGARASSSEKNMGRIRRRDRRSFSGPRRRHRASSVSESPRRRSVHQKSPRDENRSDSWAWSNGDDKKIAKVEAIQKQEEARKPNFALSGKLTEDTNTYKGVVIKYNEPAEARMPKKRWRLYPFKGDESLPTLYIHRQSAYLVGRDRAVTDFPVHHPSCSKQHAVFQYRLVEVEKSEGVKSRQIKLYIIDLNSTNGTYVNNKRIEPQRYIELKATDMLRFGYSSREYILLNEDSQEEEIQMGSDQEQLNDSSQESEV